MSGEPGILAIFNDCRAGREAEFEAWFQREHLVERLSVPGFVFGRRHKGLSGSPGYFNFYMVETPAVLTSKPYLERLDHPTPLTRTIMSDVFVNMNRTVCRRVARGGSFRGAFAVVVRFDGTADEPALRQTLEELTADTAVAGGEIWVALDAAGMPVSMEEKLRGGDKKIAGALMVDTLYEEDANAVAARLATQFPDAMVSVFRVLCQIGRGDL
ncbi:MAG TPA: hypothetical protein VHX43_04140 [Xanthobacteraceae bacterium]|jgi:hypothetical protein|nr:hypothetical protein [Xanthobacteraceae bacterium]